MKRIRNEQNIHVKKTHHDIPEYLLEMVGIFGCDGKGWSELINPTCFRIWKNCIFISDFFKHSIDIFTLNGFYVTSFTHEFITKPCGVALNDQAMYIIYLHGFSWYLAKVNEFGISTKALFIAHPLKLVCDYNSNLYLAVLNDRNIIVYDQDLTASNFTDICFPKIKDMDCSSQHLIILSDEPSFLTFFDFFGAKIRTIGLDFPYFHPRLISVDSYGTVLISNPTDQWLTSVGTDERIRYFIINGISNDNLVNFAVSNDSQIFFLLKGIHPYFKIFGHRSTSLL